MAILSAQHRLRDVQADQSSLGVIVTMHSYSCLPHNENNLLVVMTTKILVTTYKNITLIKSYE